MDRSAGFDVLRPDPGGTIRSLTALGYTPEAAIADLVDNSIAAGARTVAIRFHWAGAADSTVSVVDDGRGMTEQELLRGMTVGGRGLDTDRSDRDFGRFGMGLKTASFSQCRQLIVATRPDEARWLTRTWDIEHVLAVGDWQLLHNPPERAEDALGDLTSTQAGPGTVVLWRHLTRLVAPGSEPGDAWAQKEFHTHIRTVERHLGMVFGRYLSRRTHRLRLSVNGNAVEAWDPFLTDNRWVSPLPQERPVPGVTIRGFVLPHRSRLSDAELEEAGGPRGWLDQQGYYIYRQDRLIVAGGWLGLGFRKEDRYNLARLSVDVSTDEDADWSVDVRKSSATPPVALAGHLRRLARATRARAAEVVAHKGNVVRSSPQTPSRDVTWQQVNQFGRTFFRINRGHPLVLDLLARYPDARSALNVLLRLIEDTLPIGIIAATPNAGPDPTATRSVAPDAVVEMAGEVLEALVSQGNPAAEAVRRLLAMPPFDSFPNLADQLHEGGI